MGKKVFVSFIVATCFWFTSTVQARKLILVHALWRHGDRNPVHYIPTDKKNSVEKWPQGLEGELTSTGMMQEFTLGEQLASRYSTSLKLSPEHVATDIYVRSDDVNRTLMSAYSVFAGMIKGQRSVTYPDSDLWPNNWQPIPVHTLPRSEDKIIRHLYCPKALELWRSVKNSSAWQNESTANQDFLDWLSNKTEISNVSLDNIDHIFDPLEFESFHPKTHPWPAWVNQSIFDRITQMNYFGTSRLYHLMELAKLKGGNLLNDIIKRNEWKAFCANNQTEKKCKWINQLKFYAYSAHDSTIMGVLETLARNDINGKTGAESLTEGFPHLGACLLVELFQETSGKFTVDISYKNYYNYKLFVPVPVSSCFQNGTCWLGPCGKGSCSLDQFVERSKLFISTNWAKECGLASSEETAGSKSSEEYGENLLRNVNFDPTPRKAPESQQLVLTQVVFRHGVRTPAYLFPTDTGNNLSTWFQNALGELTPQGMMEEFVLGQQLAARYGQLNNIVDPNFVASQMYVRSTDYNRTLMSAYAYLAGMFHKSKNLMIPKNLRAWPTQWQPMPVHTVPRAQDNVLWWPDCQTYFVLLYKKVFSSPEWQKFNQTNADFINWLSNKTGITVSLPKMYQVSDPLLFENINGHEWPDWVNDTVFHKILQLKAFSDRHLFHQPELARLKGGSLLGEIVGRMQSKANCLINNTCSGTIKPLKYYVYSGHDLSVMALLETLARENVGNLTGAAALTGGLGGLPAPGSTVMVDLFQEPNGSFTVKVHFKQFFNASDILPVPVSGGCESGVCSLETFASRSIPFIPKNWKKECTFSPPPPPATTTPKTGTGYRMTPASCFYVVVLLLYAFHYKQRMTML